MASMADVLMALPAGAPATAEQLAAMPPSPEAMEAARAYAADKSPPRARGLVGLAAVLDQVLGGLPSTAAQGLQNLYNAAYGKPYSDEITEGSKGLATDFAKHGPLPENLVRDLMAMPEAFAGNILGAMGRVPHARATASGLPAQASEYGKGAARLGERAAMLPDDMADALQRIDHFVKRSAALADQKSSHMAAKRASRRATRVGRGDAFESDVLKPIQDRTRINRLHATATDAGDDITLVDKRGAARGMSSDDFNYEIDRRAAGIADDPARYARGMADSDGTDVILGLKMPEPALAARSKAGQSPASFEADIRSRYAAEPESLARLLQEPQPPGGVIIAEGRAPVRHQFRPQTSALDDATEAGRAGRLVVKPKGGPKGGGKPNSQGAGLGQKEAATTEKVRSSDAPSKALTAQQPSTQVVNKPLLMREKRLALPSPSPANRPPKTGEGMRRKVGAAAKGAGRNRGRLPSPRDVRDKLGQAVAVTKGKGGRLHDASTGRFVRAGDKSNVEWDRAAPENLVPKGAVSWRRRADRTAYQKWLRATGRENDADSWNKFSEIAGRKK